MRKRIIICLLLTTTSAVAMIILFTFADEARILRAPFKRTFNQMVNVLDKTNVGTDDLYIAGFAENSIFLGQRRTLVLYRYAFENDHLSRLSSFHVPDHHFEKSYPVTTIDERGLSFVDYRYGKLYSARLHDTVVTQTYLKSYSIADAVKGANQVTVIRTFKEGARELTLAFIDENGNLERNTSLLEKQVDGVFCTDGKLNYLQDSGDFTYCYFYRNEFFRFDSLLNLKYRANTIDTFNRVTFSVANNHNTEIKTIAEPHVAVNRLSVVSDNKMYVVSNVMGDEEDERIFRSSDIIDVYELNHGKYIGSITIPRFNNTKIRDIFVTSTFIFGVYKNNLVVYQVKPIAPRQTRANKTL